MYLTRCTPATQPWNRTTPLGQPSGHATVVYPLALPRMPLPHGRCRPSSEMAQCWSSMNLPSTRPTPTLHPIPRHPYAISPGASLPPTQLSHHTPPLPFTFFHAQAISIVMVAIFAILAKKAYQADWSPLLTPDPPDANLFFKAVWGSVDATPDSTKLSFTFLGRGSSGLIGRNVCGLWDLRLTPCPPCRHAPVPTWWIGGRCCHGLLPF